jgi:hypothetical protein
MGGRGTKSELGGDSGEALLLLLEREEAADVEDPVLPSLPLLAVEKAVLLPLLSLLSLSKEVAVSSSALRATSMHGKQQSKKQAPQ